MQIPHNLFCPTFFTCVWFFLIHLIFFNRKGYCPSFFSRKSLILQMGCNCGCLLTQVIHRLKVSKMNEVEELFFEEDLFLFKNVLLLRYSSFRICGLLNFMMSSKMPETTVKNMNKYILLNNSRRKQSDN